MKNTYKVIILCILLVFCCSLPAMALDAGYQAQITKLSGDVWSGYYVEYTINGITYRSDQTGSRINMMAWAAFDEQDRRKIMHNYAFAPDYRKDQFGEDGSTEMTDWINDVTGWTGAREMLKSRIAQQNFPQLFDFYEQNSNLPIFDIGDPDYIDLNTITNIDMPEYQELRRKMEEAINAYSIGRTAYQHLITAKSQQVQTAVQSISANLISLIVERMLVPNITPSGLGGISASLRGEIIGFLDKALNISNQLYDSTITYQDGDQRSAREIIDALWQIIICNQGIADAAMRECNSLCDTITNDYADLQQLDSQLTENRDSILTDLNAQIEPVLNPDPLPVPTIPEENQTVSDIMEELRIDYLDWRNQFYQEYNAIRQTWPDNCGNYEPIPGDLSSLFTNSSDYFTIVGEASTKRNQAVTKLRNDITAISAYKTAAENLIHQASADFDAIYARLRGMESQLDDYFIWHSNLITDATIEENFQYRGGLPCLELATDLLYRGSISLATYIEQLENQILEIEDDYTAFQQEQTDVEQAMLQAASQYAEAQTNYLNAVDYRIGSYNQLLTFRTNLPDYIKEQPIEYSALDGFTFTIVPPSGGNPAGNPILYNMLMALDWDARYAKWAELSEQCYQLETEENNYIRRIDNSLNHITYYEGELEALGQGSTFLANLGQLSGQDLQTVGALNQDRGYDHSYSTTISSNATPTIAIGLLADDLGGSNSYCAKMLRLYNEIETKRAAVLRMSDKTAAMTQVTKWENTAIDQISMTINSYYEQAMARSYTHNKLYNELYYAKIKPQLDQIRNYLNNGFTPVSDLSKGSSGSNNIFQVGDPILLNTEETSDLSIPVGGSGVLSATISPANATDNRLIWYSDNIDIATVDGDGLVSGISPGTAIITVRAMDSVATTIGEITTYDPAPLSFSVQVGSGQPAPFVWRNYGTAEQPNYILATHTNGVLSVKAELIPNISEDLVMVLILYCNNRMISYNIQTATVSQNVVFELGTSTRLPIIPAQGVQVKILFLNQNSTFTPYSPPPLTETIYPL